MKALCLIRVSTGHQDIDSQSVKVKAEAIKDGYSEENIIMIEDVESAVKLSEEERNGLTKLKQYIENDPSINCVYTYEISRISRQASIVYSIRDFLIKHNIQLIVMNPYFKMLKDDGSLSETSNIFFGIFSSLSENEGYLRKARIKKAVEKYKKEGRHIGGNYMFGYTVDHNHQYVIHPENAAIVRTIFNMYVNDNMSIRAIAKEMYERGIKFWTCKTNRTASSYLTACCNINTILHRREYIGEERPRIITDEVFERAQYIMKNKTICATRTKVDALLRGMLYNKENGLLLSANAATKYYYSKRMKGPSISFECADKIIWDWICDKHNTYKEMSNKKISERLEYEYKILDKKIMQQFNRRNELLQQIDTLEERIVIGRISKQKGDALGLKLQNEIEELDKSYVEMQEERINIKSKLSQLDKINTLDIESLTLDEKIKLIHEMISKIYIERIDRTTCKLYIENKITSVDNEIILVDTYHKNVIHT